MVKEFRLDNHKVSQESSPFLIAELSANHGGEIERAKKSIEMASKIGVSAVKLQTYTPDTMTINSKLPDFLIKEGLWKGRSLYELYSEAFTPFEWHEELFSHARKHNITIFSTPFDESAVDLLEELNTPAYKIASFEIVDIPLISYIAKKKKPIFMSTGMASQEEIALAVKTIRDVSDAGLLLFHCVSSYPTITEQSNLNNITWLKDKFDVQVGLSDHTLDNIASLTAIGMGAVAIEKHFKLDDLECGPDSSFSLNKEQLENLVVDCQKAWQARGKPGLNRAPSERQNMVFRRSLYFVKSLKKGHILTEGDIRKIRPGFGLSPKHLPDVLGKKLIESVEEGQRVTFEVLSN